MEIIYPCSCALKLLTILFLESSKLFGLYMYKYCAICKIFLLIAQQHNVRQINSVPFILVNELTRSTAALIIFLLMVQQLFYSWEKTGFVWYFFFFPYKTSWDFSEP